MYPIDIASTRAKCWWSSDTAGMVLASNTSLPKVAGVALLGGQFAEVSARCFKKNAH